MKKLLCVCLVLVLCCTLAACNPVAAYKNYAANSGNGVPVIFGNIVLDIQSDSMSPTFSAGDTIICKTVDTGTLEKDDIIAYWTVINGERVINVHRIHEIYDGGDHLLFATKGDNNTSVDPLIVHESNVIGKYERKAFLGFL